MAKLKRSILSIFLIVSCFLASKPGFANDQDTDTNSLPQWKIQHLPGKPSLRASAANEQVLWVGGTQGKIFKSLDQGKNWIDVSLKNNKLDVRDLEIFGRDTAIAMTAGEGLLSKLMKTTDGGKSWTILLNNDHKKGFYDSIDFWNDQKGLLLGDPVDGYYMVLSTEDGGESWQRIPKKQLPPFKEKEYAFAASGNTLITGSQGQAWIAMGGFSASVYYSNDYGQNWQRLSVPLHKATETSGVYGLGLNQKLDAFAVGGDYQNRPGQYANVSRFDRVEKRWLPVNNNHNGLRTALFCVKQWCLATGKVATDISKNQGLDWHHFSDEGFYTLTANQHLFLAAGHDGRVGVITFK